MFTRDDLVGAYYVVTNPMLRLIRRARWRWAPGTMASCEECGRPAQWSMCTSALLEYFMCDDCVPRGCECHIMSEWVDGKLVEVVDADGKPVEARDRIGRLYPCVDWDFSTTGWPKPRQQAPVRA